jgi:hypothetical protein
VTASLWTVSSSNHCSCSAKGCSHSLLVSVSTKMPLGIPNAVPLSKASLIHLLILLQELSQPLERDCSQLPRGT